MSYKNIQLINLPQNVKLSAAFSTRQRLISLECDENNAKLVSYTEVSEK